MAIEKLYTVPEAAETIRCSIWMLWAWLRDGKIKRTKFGAKTLIRESELTRLLRDPESTIPARGR